MSQSPKATTFQSSHPPTNQQKTFEEGEGRYHRGGFHPVRLGELYNAKYKVLRKLGYGRYSTVWLVRNQDDQSFWAMKILSAECYGFGTDIYELEVLQHLRKASTEHIGYQYISSLQDSFSHEGPNGSHVCLIFKVMGESFSTFRLWFEDYQVPNPLVQRFTTQLLHALDYAHSCGVIHTDIQPGNIMLQIPDESLIRGYLESTDTDRNPQNESAELTIIPTQGLRNFYFPEGDFNMMTLEIALSDWGVASWADNHLTELIQPVLLRAPEVILEAGWGFPVDIWNVGALVPELLYAQRMFSGKTQSGEYTTELHLEEMAALFGPFPRVLLSKANPNILRDLFDVEGKIQTPELVKSVGLEDRFASMPIDERTKFVAFIKSMMTLDPEKRKSTKELLEEPWLKHEYTDDIRVEA